MTRFGPVSADKRETYQTILSQAFSLSDGRRTDSADRDSADDEWPPTLFGPRGVFDGDELVSVCKKYTLDARLHGEFVSVGGIGGVATPPEHRRQGHVRTLAAGLLDEYREDGVHLTALWPFSTPFYRNLGWGISNKFTEYTLPPAQLGFGRGADGRCRRLDLTDWERLRTVEVAATAGTNLSLRRSEEWWHERTLAAWDGDTAPYIYGYERDGELRGYVLYSVTSTSGGRTLTVDDLVARDEDAYRGLLAFLADQDSQIETVVLRRATETELLEFVPNPDVVECTVKTGPMVRLTGVADPLESYPWPDEVDTQFTLAVSDPLLDHADGLFTVTVDNGEPTVAREGSDRGGDDADLTTDIRTLSQLFVGTYSLAEVEQYGTLTVNHEPLREQLGTGFEGSPVCLREFF